jgi:hypothetical protein
MRLTMLLRVVSQEAIKMETRVQAGFYLVLKVYSPLQKRLLTTRNIFEGSLVFFVICLASQSFIFSELTRHYFHPIDFCFRGLLFIWQTVAERDFVFTSDHL